MCVRACVRAFVCKCVTSLIITELIVILREQLTAQQGSTSLIAHEKGAETASVATIRRNQCSMTVKHVPITKRPHPSAARVWTTANVRSISSTITVSLF